MTFWDRIATGEALRVNVPEETRKPATRTRIVRTAPYSHYEGYNARHGGRPRCRARGCRKWLTKTQTFACCHDHETKVRDQLASLHEAVENTCAV